MLTCTTCTLIPKSFSPSNIPPGCLSCIAGSIACLCQPPFCLSIQLIPDRPLFRARVKRGRSGAILLEFTHGILRIESELVYTPNENHETLVAVTKSRIAATSLNNLEGVLCSIKVTCNFRQPEESEET